MSLKTAVQKETSHIVLLPHDFFYLPPFPNLPSYSLLKASKVENPGQRCDFLSPQFHTSLQERNKSPLLIRKSHSSEDPQISSWTEKQGNSKGREAKKKITPHMANTAKKLLLVDKPLSVLNTHSEGQWVSYTEAGALWHTKLSISSSSAGSAELSQAQSARLSSTTS